MKLIEREGRGDALLALIMAPHRSQSRVLGRLPRWLHLLDACVRRPAAPAETGEEVMTIEIDPADLEFRRTRPGASRYEISLGGYSFGQINAPIAGVDMITRTVATSLVARRLAAMSAHERLDFWRKTAANQTDRTHIHFDGPSF